MPGTSAGRTIALRLKAWGDAAIGALVIVLYKAIRLINPDLLSNLGGFLMRHVGPLLREHRIGRANLAAAFPDKSPAEIETILRGAWDNLGRVGAEFAHLDRLWDYDITRKHRGRIRDSDESLARIFALRDDGKPAIIFSAHLANWEISALAAHAFGLDTAVLYRRPNLGAVADAVVKLRSGSMGTLIPTGLDAPFKLSRILEGGGHVAILVDQHFVRGVDVTFFGRPCKANPLVAQLAHHLECPIYGSRVLRFPGNQFQVELTDEIEPVRGADGKIDIAGTMQVITSVVEGWVREHPEQWLWMHRRWR